nr:mitochondrial dicarboxylate carrier [Zonotrichia albicollis]
MSVFMQRDEQKHPFPRARDEVLCGSASPCQSQLGSKRTVLIQICLSTEGVKNLFSGASVASIRGALVTVGQLSCYDQAKQLVLATGFLSDNVFTHFLSSVIAGLCATFLCQPLDVLKTRLMNSHGEYQGVTHCAVETAKLGPLAFYKVPGWGRRGGAGWAALGAEAVAQSSPGGELVHGCLCTPGLCWEQPLWAGTLFLWLVGIWLSSTAGAGAKGLGRDRGRP